MLSSRSLQRTSRGDERQPQPLRAGPDIKNIYIASPVSRGEFFHCHRKHRRSENILTTHLHPNIRNTVLNSPCRGVLRSCFLTYTRAHSRPRRMRHHLFSFRRQDPPTRVEVGVLMGWPSQRPPCASGEGSHTEAPGASIFSHIFHVYVFTFVLPLHILATGPILHHWHVCIFLYLPVHRPLLWSRAPAEVFAVKPSSSLRL